MKKLSKASVSKKDFVKGHKEATKKSDYATADVGCGEGLAGKICRHNRKKLNRFVAVKAHVKKSLDFKDTLVSVDPKDQMLAEITTSKALLEYIRKNISNSASDNPQASQWSIPFPTGILKLNQREPGIYHGSFQDRDGQVVEKFDSQTVAIIAKTLELKSLVPESVEVEPQQPPVAAPEPGEMAMAAHNRIDELQRQIINQVKGKSIHIKYGDFELEIKKSLRDFVNDFRSSRTPDKDLVRKAISSWRKKHSEYMILNSDHAAAKELTENWDAHQESFCQFVDALSRGSDDEQR